MLVVVEAPENLKCGVNAVVIAVRSGWDRLRMTTRKDFAGHANQYTPIEYNICQLDRMNLGIIKGQRWATID